MVNIFYLFETTPTIRWVVKLSHFSQKNWSLKLKQGKLEGVVCYNTFYWLFEGFIKHNFHRNQLALSWHVRMRMTEYQPYSQASILFSSHCFQHVLCGSMFQFTLTHTHTHCEVAGRASLKLCVCVSCGLSHQSFHLLALVWQSSLSCTLSPPCCLTEKTHMRTPIHMTHLITKAWWHFDLDSLHQAYKLISSPGTSFGVFQS